MHHLFWVFVICYVLLERSSDLAVLEFGGFRAWPFLSLAVAKIDPFSNFSGFVFLGLNRSQGSGF